MIRKEGACVVFVAIQRIRAGIVSTASAGRVEAIPAAPDDHLTAGPDCRMVVSGSGRVGGAGGRPTVGAGIVSASGVQTGAVVISAPDDHFAASPQRRVIEPGSGRVGGAGGRPTVRARIVSARRCSDCRCCQCPPQTIISLPVHTAV